MTSPPSQPSTSSHDEPVRRYARLELADGRRVFVELASGRAFVLSAAPWHGGSQTGEVVGCVDDDGRCPHGRTLAPVAPTKVLCVGRNYRAHASELGNEVPAEPLFFFKPPSSILDPGGAVELPPEGLSARVEHEAELAVVIGRRARRVSAQDAGAHVFGLTILCDVTARDLQKKDGQWWRAKGMDTFCPVGPAVVTGIDPHGLDIECRVNGERRQRGNTSEMVFGVPELIAYVSRAMTLEPGDVLSTGTPAGVGPLRAGDLVEIAVARVGTLAVRVVPPSP